MWLQWRVLVLVLVLFVGGNLAVWSLARVVLLDGYQGLEESHLQQHLQLLSAALTAETDSLAGVAKNEAAWDAAYRFMQDRNPTFVESDMASLGDLNLDLVLYVDSTGQVVYGKVAASGSDSGEVDISASQAQVFHEQPQLWQFSSTDSERSGLLLTPAGMMLVGSSPITRSDYSGPILGSLILGRLLDAEKVAALEEQFQFKPLSLNLLSEAQSSSDPDSATSDRSERDVTIRLLDEQNAEASLLIRDLQGKVAAQFVSIQPRTVYVYGLQTLSSFNQWVFGLSLLTSLLIYFLAVKWLHSKQGLEQLSGKYQRLFEWSEVPIFEEDFSDVYRALDRLRETGVSDLRDYLERQPSRVLELLGKLRFTDVNQAVLRAYGGSDKRELLSDPQKIIPETALPDAIDMLCAIWSGAEHFRCEPTNRHLDGSLMTCLLSMPLPARTEDAVAVPVCVLDITARVEAEKLLKESEADLRQLTLQFQTVLDSVPEGLLLLSSELNVEWINRSALEAMEKSLHDVSGKHCYQELADGQAPCDGCPVVNCFQTGQGDVFRQRQTDGTVVERRFLPVKNTQGKTVNMIVSSRDLTEELKTRAETIRTGQLAALGELAAGVAHEINNPLNGIINYAQILLMQAQRENRSDQFSPRIIKEGERIARIVAQLLTFAQGKNDNEKRAVTLKAVLDGILPLVIVQMRVDGIEIVAEIPPDLPPLLACEQQLQQVLLNLLSNAKYAILQKSATLPEDKVIRVSAEAARPDRVRICVSDRGVGIPAAVLAKITNPFFTTKPQGVGTGLGLSISHGIITSHQGSLRFDSVEGDYTKVYVEIPTAR